MSNQLRVAATSALALILTILGVAPAASASNHRTDDVRVTVGTHNTLRGAASFTGLADVIGWQEVKYPAVRAKLRRSLPAYSHFTPNRGGSGSDSVSWRTRKFDLVSSGVARTHGGVARLTPSRYITWVVLRHQQTGQKLTVVNTHFVNGAFKAHKSRHAFRLRMWQRHARTLRDVVAHLKRKGYPMFVVGDFNSRSTLRLPGVVRATPTGRVSIDQIYVPRTHTLRSTGTGAGRRGAVNLMAATKAKRLSRRGSDHFAFRSKVFLPTAG